MRTDAAGRWRFDSVPESLGELGVEINHPQFMPMRATLVRGEYGLASEEQARKPIVLQRGLTLAGRVTDDAGQPIAGALVRTKFINNMRETRTNAAGAFELSGCEPGMGRLVVSATGRAMDLKEVRVAPHMAPVDFKLPPGGTIRVRVVDESNHPVPRTRIFFQRWRGSIDYFEFDHVPDRADENGVWEWHEAPLDQIKVDICPPGGMQLIEQPISPRDEEYVFHTSPALVVTGSVIDALTKEPIPAFHVTPGIREGRPQLQWFNNIAFDAKNGKYEYRQDRGYDAHYVRIEAPGYVTTASREINSDEGAITVNFELQRGRDVVATVLTPDGQPARGAKIAVGIAGSQIDVKNGEIDDTSTYAARLEPDDSGKIHIPYQNSDYQLIITHAAGFANVKSGPGAGPAKIVLTAWAKATGTFRVGSKLQGGVPLGLNVGAIESYGDGQPHIFTSHEITTGPQGQFEFPRVFPGMGRIGRRIMLTVDNGAADVTSSAMVTAEFFAGKTTQLELGGVGRPVTGKLQPPPKFQDDVLWNFAVIEVRPDIPVPLHLEMPPAAQIDAEHRRQWWLQFLQTNEGKASRPTFDAYEQIRSSAPFYTATVAPDGSFRIDDMPAGDYVMNVRFDRQPAGHLQNRPFSVAPDDDDAPQETADLGVLTLESD